MDVALRTGVHPSATALPVRRTCLIDVCRRPASRLGRMTKSAAPHAPPDASPADAPEAPNARGRALLAALGRVPQGAFSRAFGKMADVRLPRPLRRPVLGGFARLV